MLIISRLSLEGVEGEGQVQQVQHENGGVAKRMSPLYLLFLPLLQYHTLINTEELQYRPQPIDPLTEMVLGHQLQEWACAEEGQ